MHVAPPGAWRGAESSSIRQATRSRHSHPIRMARTLSRFVRVEDLVDLDLVGHALRVRELEVDGLSRVIEVPAAVAVLEQDRAVGLAAALFHDVDGLAV